MQKADPLTLPATVFVIDDDDDVRESIVILLKGLAESIESFASAEQFLRRLDKPGPGCLVLDIRLTGISGIDLQKRLGESAVFLTIVMVSGHANVPISVEAMRRGASDVLEKPFAPERLRAAVSKGLHDAVKLWEKHQQRRQIQRMLNDLTPRECEVLDLLRRGESVKELAMTLQISPSTAEKHRLKVFEKLGVRDVPHLLLMSRIRTDDGNEVLLRRLIANLSIAESG